MKKGELDWDHRPRASAAESKTASKVGPLALGDLAVASPLHFRTWITAELGRQGAMRDLGWRARDQRGVGAVGRVGRGEN